MKWGFILALAIVVAAGHRAYGKNCSMSVNPMPFGSYDVFSATDTNAAPMTITFSCNGANTISIEIAAGTASSSFAPRSLTQTSQPNLDYYFYTDAAHTQIWGDGTNGSSVYTQTVAKSVQYTIPIYGRIVGGQDVNVGSYSEPTALTVSLRDVTGKQDSATLTVTANVVQACKISTGALSFGNYDPVSTNKSADLTVTSANAVSVRCTRGSTASTISLGKGLQPNPVASFARYMASGANRLAYQIYTSAARTTIWGDGTLGTATRAVSTPTSYLTAQSFAAYGTVPSAQDVYAGAYVDTVAATVNF